ncbi:MAG: flippase-like domain-containing protein [Gemmatimonadaceae bacterium]|nr:flippase-like domain-containing protein [Gemmatimonadaceae bacterium]
MSPAVSRAIRLALTGVILVMLVVFATRVNWHDTWNAIRSASRPLLLAAALINIASIVVKAVRWWIFLRPIGARSLPLALRATFAGAGLNNVLVANGGEAARVVFVARSAHIPSATVLATLALERLFELVGYVTLLAGAATFLDLPPSLERVKPFAIAILGGMLALLVWLLRRPEAVAMVATPRAGNWQGRLRDYGRRFAHTIAQVSSAPRFAGALTLSVIAWALQVATYQMTARAAHFPMSPVATIAALLAVNLGFALRATPGNVGLFQFAYAATAAAFGLNQNEAIAVAFLIQAQQIFPVTLLGVALAPEFIFRSVKKRSTDVPGQIPSDSRSPVDSHSERRGEGR